MSYLDCRRGTYRMFESNPIDDSVCAKVTKAIHLRQKQHNVDVIMQVITDYVKNKGTDNATKELSADEVLLCAREVLGGDNEKHKDDICVYLQDHCKRLITKQSVTEFLCLFNIWPSSELRDSILHRSWCSESLYLTIIEADWKLVNYEAMIVILDNTGRWWVPRLSIVMRWLLEKQGYLDDPSNKFNVAKLLSSVCLEDMPPKYRDTVLYPYLKNTFLSRDVQLTNVKEGDEYYRCSVHEGRRCGGSKAWTMKVIALPAEFYSLQKDAKVKIPYNERYHGEVALKINEDPCLAVNVVRTSRGEVVGRKGWFTLFNKDNCMDRYPALRDELTKEELRELIAKHKNLCVAILYRY